MKTRVLESDGCAAKAGVLVDENIKTVATSLAADLMNYCKGLTEEEKIKDFKHRVNCMDLSSLRNVGILSMYAFAFFGDEAGVMLRGSIPKAIREREILQISNAKGIDEEFRMKYIHLLKG